MIILPWKKKKNITTMSLMSECKLANNSTLVLQAEYLISQLPGCETLTSTGTQEEVQKH